MYPSDDTWQETVLGLMRESGLVVIAAGLGDGLIWELLQAVQTVSPDRLVLVVFMDSKSYGWFRETSTKAFAASARKLRSSTGKVWSPPVLPEYPSEAELGDATSWIIRFESDWTPVSVTLSKTSRSSPRHIKSLWMAFSEALLPTFEKLEVEASVIDKISNTLVRSRRIGIISIYLVILFLGAAFGLLIGQILGPWAGLTGCFTGATIAVSSKAGRDLVRDIRDVPKRGENARASEGNHVHHPRVGGR